MKKTRLMQVMAFLACIVIEPDAQAHPGSLDLNGGITRSLLPLPHDRLFNPGHLRSNAPEKRWRHDKLSGPREILQ